MINPNDYVLIYRNGHLSNVGIATTLRGFNQDRINIRCIGDYWYNHGTMEVDRANGIADPQRRVKVVTETEWKDVDKRLNDEAASRRLEEERIYQMDINRKIELLEKAKQWYENLPPDQKELADVWTWHCTPIAVA